MKTDSETLCQWIDEDLDGTLAASDRAALGELLEHDAEARTEHRTLASLHRLIAESRIAVRPGFTGRVMAVLPTAWWEQCQPAGSARRWAVPLAVLLALSGAAILVLGSAEEIGPFSGVGLAVLEFLQMTLLAGSGMLFATWRGFGYGVEELIADSEFNLLALAAGVAFLNLLLLSLLRRRSPAAETAAGGEPGTPEAGKPPASRETS